MGLCKCPKRKVTNLFCFEHDVNVCEYCLVSDHERCIVQSYVQWLQDSDYNPICTLCNKLLKDEATVRLLCYDVFHWSCLDKYASSMPATTAPAGYQCPKCKECIFPSANQVSPVADVLKEKLKSASWSRIGLGQSIIEASDASGLEAEAAPEAQRAQEATAPGADEEKSDFVIVPKQTSAPEKPAKAAQSAAAVKPTQLNKASGIKSAKSELNRAFDPTPGETTTTLKFNRNVAQHEEDSQIYDTSIGMILNESVDRDTGDYKYQRRPLFEWLSRWLKSRQLSGKGSLFRMTRQKRNLFIALLFFLGLFTLCIIMSRLSSGSSDDNPNLDPMNNPNIHVEDNPN